MEHNIRRLRLWQEYFLRYDSTSTLQNVETEEVKDFEDRERLSTHTQDMVVWVADNKASECKGCSQKFSYLIRRKVSMRSMLFCFCFLFCCCCLQNLVEYVTTHKQLFVMSMQKAYCVPIMV